MENKKVSFDNINLLKSFIKEGKFSALNNNIKNLKVKMDNLCKQARTREKELLAQVEADKIKQARIEEIKQGAAKLEPVVEVKQEPIVTQPQQSNNIVINNRQPQQNQQFSQKNKKNC